MFKTTSVIQLHQSSYFSFIYNVFYQSLSRVTQNRARKRKALPVRWRQISNQQAPVVQTLDSAIQWINIYPVDSVIGFASTYPLDSDLSDG